MRERPNVVNEQDLEWGEQSHGKFGYSRKQLGSAAGGEKLGCSLYEVPPGRRAWPYHYHLANEEAIYVLHGSGTLRIGEREVAVSQGELRDCRRESQERTRAQTPRMNHCATSASRPWTNPR